MIQQVEFWVYIQMVLKRYLHLHVHCSVIHIYTHTMEYYSAMYKGENSANFWWCEISQKNLYCVISLTFEIWKTKLIKAEQNSDCQGLGHGKEMGAYQSRGTNLQIKMSTFWNQIDNLYSVMIIVNSTTYVRSVYFSPPVLVSLQQKFEMMKLKDLKQQTSYNSVTAQAGLFCVGHSQDMGAGRPQRDPSNPSWLLCFYTSLSSFWLYPVQNRACTHH